MLRKLSLISGYLALLLVALALLNFPIAISRTTGHEFLANLAFYELIAAFCCFAFWAVSATYLAIESRKAK